MSCLRATSPSFALSIILPTLYVQKFAHHGFFWNWGCARVQGVSRAVVAVACPVQCVPVRLFAWLVWHDRNSAFCSQSVEGEHHEKAVELLKAAKDSVKLVVRYTPKVLEEMEARFEKLRTARRRQQQQLLMQQQQQQNLNAQQNHMS